MESHEPGGEIKYGLISSAEIKLHSGYEVLNRIISGDLPLPPMCKVMQFRLVEVALGRVVFSGQPTADYYNPLGVTHGGYVATLLDFCMAFSIHSVLPAGTSYTTLEVKINFVRSLTESTGPIKAEGKIISAGRQVGIAEGRVFDARNKAYAYGTTTCLIFSAQE